MNKVLRYVKDVFYPPRCVFCDEVIARSQRPICPTCRKQEIPQVPNEICTKCGRGKNDCVCKSTTFLTDGVVGVYYYEDAVKEGIKHFKKVEDIDRIEYFEQQLSESAFLHFAEKQVDLITTVPLHKKAFTERGFDQLYPVAKRLSKTLHTPYERILRKIFATEPQKERLRADERAGNVLGVFDVCTKLSLKDKNILLLDDVVTTGSTTNECAKMLKIYGAKNVYVLAVALSRPNKKEKEDKNDPIAELKRKLSGKVGSFT